MLRIGGAAAAAVLFAAGVTPLAPSSRAQAEPKASIALCRDVLVPNRPASNLGECLSYITVAANGSEGEASHQCDFLEENDPDTFELMFVSRTDCIQAFGGRGPYN